MFKVEFHGCEYQVVFGYYPHRTHLCASLEYDGQPAGMVSTTTLDHLAADEIVVPREHAESGLLDALVHEEILVRTYRMVMTHKGLARVCRVMPAVAKPQVKAA